MSDLIDRETLRCRLLSIIGCYRDNWTREAVSGLQKLADDIFPRPDPFEDAYRELLAKWQQSDEGYRIRNIVRDSLELGIQIGREQQP